MNMRAHNAASDQVLQDARGDVHQVSARTGMALAESMVC